MRGGFLQCRTELSYFGRLDADGVDLEIAARGYVQRAIIPGGANLDDGFEFHGFGFVDPGDMPEILGFDKKNAECFVGDFLHLDFYSEEFCARVGVLLFASFSHGERLSRLEFAGDFKLGHAFFSCNHDVTLALP